jgi:hypothetical protein
MRLDVDLHLEAVVRNNGAHHPVRMTLEKVAPFGRILRRGGRPIVAWLHRGNSSLEEARQRRDSNPRPPA